MAKFIIVFGVLGFFISFLIGLISGGTVLLVLRTAFFSGFVSVGMGFAIYHIFSQKVPELFSFWNDRDANPIHKVGLGKEKEDPADTSLPLIEDSLEDDEVYSKQEFPKEKDSLDSIASEDTSEITKESTNLLGHKNSSRKKSFGSHKAKDMIEVKNEPKVLAEAVRTMMNADEENTLL